MKLIAHRGYVTKCIKENTLEAFKNAQNESFDGIECDVRATKDGKIVVIHDASIDRVSDGSGFVRDLTYNQLKRYNYGSREVPSGIPLLTEVLEKFDTMKIVELKTRIDIGSILEYVDDKTYFISFDTHIIKEIKKTYPKLKVGILNYVLNSSSDYEYDVVCILDVVANDKIVMRFLERGIKVFIYGIVGEINYKRDYENLYYIVDKKY